MFHRLSFLAACALAPCACGTSEAKNDEDGNTPSDADKTGGSGVLVEVPPTPGSGFLSATSFDLSGVGYTQAEYFVSGTATAYVNVGDLNSDGHWTVQPGNSADYKTRIMVFRPVDASRFNGTVFVEWLNVSGGLDAAPDWIAAHTELIREGYAYVGVSAQKVGVEGGGALLPGSGIPDLNLKSADPERYGSLHHPGDSYSYDIFSQVGRMLRNPPEVDPLGGLKPDTMLAAGESQSAFRMVTYVDAIDPVAQVYDGFLIHSRAGGSAALSEDPEPAIGTSTVAFIRDDVRVPVLTFQTETDLLTLGSFASRQDDATNFRLWEVAGTAHADTYTLSTGGTDTGSDPSVANIVITAAPIPGIIECTAPINSGPQHWVVKAAIHALHEWARSGTAPATAPRLETTSDGKQYVLDARGNVQGGIRTPYVDAPTATLSGLGQTGNGFCVIFGTTTLLDSMTLASLYPTHADYLTAVTDSTNGAVASGFLLDPDAQLIMAAAEASSVGN